MSTSVVAIEKSPSQDDLKALLIDNEGDITEQLVTTLGIIFARFSSAYRSKHTEVDVTLLTTSPTSPSFDSATFIKPDRYMILTDKDLDDFAMATNGTSFSEESKQEIRDFLDTDDDGQLTFSGFCQMFHLQSDNEPEETWKDLRKLGFNQNLEFVGVDTDLTAEKQLQVDPDSKAEEPTKSVDDK